MARSALCATTSFDFNKHMNDINSRSTLIMSAAELQALITKNEYEQIEEEEIELALEDLDFEYIDIVELEVSELFEAQ
jgi:hypothetical protein